MTTLSRETEIALLRKKNRKNEKKRHCALDFDWPGVIKEQTSKTANPNVISTRRLGWGAGLGTTAPDSGYKIRAAGIEEVCSTGFRDRGPVNPPQAAQTYLYIIRLSSDRSARVRRRVRAGRSQRGRRRLVLAVCSDRSTIKMLSTFGCMGTSRIP